MKIKFGTLIVIAMMVICCLADETTKKKWTQEEVDRIVAQDVLNLIHGEDIDYCLECLKNEGVTKEMLADSIGKVIERLVPQKNADAIKELRTMAIDTFGRFASQKQLKLYLWVIEKSADDATASRGVILYYKYLHDKSVFVTNCIPYIEKNLSNRSFTRGMIWMNLELERKGVFGDRIVSLARKYIRDSTSDLCYADRILSAADPLYANSEERLDMLRKTVGNKKFEQQHPSLYKAIKGVYEGLLKK